MTRQHCIQQPLPLQPCAEQQSLLFGASPVGVKIGNNDEEDNEIMDKIRITKNENPYMNLSTVNKKNISFKNDPNFSSVKLNQSIDIPLKQNDIKKEVELIPYKKNTSNTSQPFGKVIVLTN